MADSFAPRKTMREVPYWEDNHQRRVYYPPVGNAIFVVYVEATALNESTIRATLANLAKDAEAVEQLEWHPSKEAGRDAAVILDVIASTNASKPVEA